MELNMFHSLKKKKKISRASTNTVNDIDKYYQANTLTMRKKMILSFY